MSLEMAKYTVALVALLALAVGVFAALWWTAPGHSSKKKRARARALLRFLISLLGLEL